MKILSRSLPACTPSTRACYVLQTALSCGRARIPAQPTFGFRNRQRNSINRCVSCLPKPNYGVTTSDYATSAKASVPVATLPQPGFQYQVALLAVAMLWGSYTPTFKLLFQMPSPPSPSLINAVQAAISACVLGIAVVVTTPRSSSSTSSRGSGRGLAAAALELAAVTFGAVSLGAAGVQVWQLQLYLNIITSTTPSSTPMPKSQNKSLPSGLNSPFPASTYSSFSSPPSPPTSLFPSTSYSSSYSSQFASLALPSTSGSNAHAPGMMPMMRFQGLQLARSTPSNLPYGPSPMATSHGSIPWQHVQHAHADYARPPLGHPHGAWHMAQGQQPYQDYLHMAWDPHFPTWHSVSHVSHYPFHMSKHHREPYMDYAAPSAQLTSLLAPWPSALHPVRPQLTTATKAAFLSQTTSLFTLLLGRLAGHPLPPSTVAACLLGVIGSVLIALDSAGGMVTASSLPPHLDSIKGQVLVLGSTFFYAVFTVRLDKYAPCFKPLELSCATSACTAVFAFTAVLVEQLTSTGAAGPLEQARCLASPEGMSLMLWAGLGPGAMSAFLQAYGQKGVSPVQAQVLYNTTPLWSALLAVAFLEGEAMGPMAWVGAAAIVGASLLAGVDWQQLAGGGSGAPGAPVSVSGKGCWDAAAEGGDNASKSTGELGAPWSSATSASLPRSPSPPSAPPPL